MRNMKSIDCRSLRMEVKEYVPIPMNLRQTLLDITQYVLQQIDPDVRHISIHFASNISRLKKEAFVDKRIMPMLSELLKSKPPPWSSLVSPREKRLDLIIDPNRIGFNREICLLEEIFRGLSHEVAEYRVITEEQYSTRWNVFPHFVRTNSDRFNAWLALQSIVRDRLADMLSAEKGFEREQFTGTMWTEWAQSIVKIFCSKEYESHPVSGLFLDTLLVDRSISLKLAGLPDLSDRYTHYMKQTLLSFEPKNRLSSFWEFYDLIRTFVCNNNLEILKIFELLQTFLIPIDTI